MRWVLSITLKAVLGLLAAAGVALSLAFLLISTDPGRRLLIPRLLPLVNGAILGKVELGGFHLLASGGIELVRVRVLDPDGREVLSAERAQLELDLHRLRSKTIGASVALDRPVVLLQEEPGGGLSIARAFSPRNPKPQEPSGPFNWTIRLRKLAIRGGQVRRVDASGRTALALEGLDLDGRGVWAPGRGGVDLSARAQLTAPEKVPLELELFAGLRGHEVRVRTLRARAGDTALEAVAQVDWVTWKGRAALLSLAVDAGEVRRLAPKAPLAADLAGTLYVESDGALATGAIDLAPRGGGGSARAAAAAHLPPGELAAGLDLHLASLDLARVLRGVPSTELTLDARAHATGRDLDTLVGGVRLSLAPSRLREGRLGPVELEARADAGTYTVTRLDARLPGAALTGSGRWRRGGAVEGTARLDARDLAALRANLEAALDRPLPAVQGAVRLDAALSGTEADPALRVEAAVPRLSTSGVALAGAKLAATLRGPRNAPRAEAEGTAEGVNLGTTSVRNLGLSARVEGRRGEVKLTGAVAGLGPDALELSGAGALSPSGDALTLERLVLAWPEARFALERPARIALQGPSVDRLALAAPPHAPGKPVQRVAVEGGLATPRRGGGAKVLDVRLAVESLDLAALPRALVPERLGAGGRVSLQAAASGPAAAPDVAGQVRLEDGAVAGVEGLGLSGDARYDGARRRARFDLALTRQAGGQVSVRGDLPVALARAGRGEKLDLTLAVREVRVAEALRLARVKGAPDVDGLFTLDAHLSGTAGTPALDAEAGLADAHYASLRDLDLGVQLRAPGREARLTARLDQARSRAVDLDLQAPLELAALLRDPKPAAAHLRRAPIRLELDVPGYALAALAGKFGVPAGTQGTLRGHASIGGTGEAPRGTVKLAVADGVLAGYRELGAEAELHAQGAATSLAVRTSLSGEELTVLTARLGLPVERLGVESAREAAALEVRLDIPHADLRHAGTSVPVAGVLTGRAELAGSLADPRLTATLQGQGIAVKGNALGELSASARGEGHGAHAELRLTPPAGGSLTGTLDVQAPARLRALAAKDIPQAQARARIVASDLDLGFLPALAPGVVRSAAGKLQATLEAQGPLGSLRPQGTLALDGGKVAVVEWGEWADVTLRATSDADTVRVEKLSARRGDGTAELHAEVAGLGRPGRAASLKADLRADKLGIPRAGQVIATVDLQAAATGTLSPEKLDVDVKVDSAVMKLPDKLPRRVQPLDQRDDIVVAPFGEEDRARDKVAGVVPVKPFHAVVHLLAPNRCQVKSRDPLVDLDLRADVTADWRTGQPLGLSGTVQTLRGRVEVQRKFDVKRGRVDFTGAGYEAGQLDVQALYDNPTAKVTVTVGGTIEKPEVKLTSDPPMDEGQIALFLATGRTQLNPGTGGTSTPIDAQALGTGAMGVVSSIFAKEVLGDKLPVDTVEASSSEIRAGKYLSDKAYIGYTWNKNARPEFGENTNQVNFQYQISRQWNFEARVGDAGTGGASLIWSKDY